MFKCDINNIMTVGKFSWNIKKVPDVKINICYPAIQVIQDPAAESLFCTLQL